MTAKKNPKQGTTDRWKDSLGQEFRPGDMIAVAVINGKSPQMVVAVVERINTTNAKGEPHMKTAWTGELKEREVVYKDYIGPEIGGWPSPYVDGSTYRRKPNADFIAERNAWAKRKQELEADPANWNIREVRTAYDEVTEKVPTVTVTAKPVLDGRGFYRSGTRRSAFETEAPAEPDVKSVTYTFVGNIIRLPDHLTLEEVRAIARRPVEYPPSWGW